MKHQAWWVSLFLACFAAGSQGHSQDASHPYSAADKIRRDTPEAVSRAIKNLDAPPRYKVVPNEAPAYMDGNFCPGDRRALPLCFEETCEEAIDVLTRTGRSVDKELLGMAEMDKPLRMRYRAALILARRGNAAVIPVLDKMCASKDTNERYLGWSTYCMAIEKKKLPAPKDVAKSLALYEKEEDSYVRDWMEMFFGAVRQKAAVPALLKSVKRDHDGSLFAIQALGDIGDTSAVPTIIEACRGVQRNSQYHLLALGKLATPEAVDFILGKVSSYAAADALYLSKSEKALPALERHVQEFKGSVDADDTKNVTAARIAIIRLRQSDPRDALMTIAEDVKETNHARRKALRALQEYDTTPFLARILQVYKRDTDNWVQETCIELLADASLDGITDAMMEHALALRFKTMEDYGTASILLRTLNQRLEIYSRTFEDLCTHIRKLRKNADQELHPARIG